MLPFVFLDDQEFLMLLLEHNTKPTYINRNEFQDIYTILNNSDYFNVANNEDSDNKYLKDVDPDNQLNHNDTCTYIIDTDEIKIKSTKELVMMTFNIRSIRKNFANFTYLLNRIKNKVHIICLTESWLGPMDNINDYELAGYHTPLYQNRVGNKHGGGVITYIHKDIEKHKLLKNLSFVDENNHCLATEVIINNKAVTLLNIYRSPNYLNDTFLSKFENCIEKVKTRVCYMLGDINYNLINIDKHAPTEEYYNIMTSKSFKPLITHCQKVLNFLPTGPHGAGGGARSAPLGGLGRAKRARRAGVRGLRPRRDPGAEPLGGG